MKKLTIALLLITVAWGCTHKKENAEHETTSTHAAPEVMQSRKVAQYSVVSFQPGAFKLTANAKNALRNYFSAAGATARQVEDVRVLSWADREYPAAETKATKAERRLADLRANSVANYISEITQNKMDIEKHNMAERPGYLAELMNTEDYEIKNSLESSGEITTTFGSEQFLSTDSKASKTMVWVEFK